MQKLIHCNKQLNKLSSHFKSFRAFELSSYFKRSSGFSLIEAIIYIALLSIIVSTAIYFIINIFGVYNKALAHRNVTSNIQNAMDTISDEIAFGKNIYFPTSVFDNDAGQLSVETKQNAPSGESATFVDFYIDNGRVYAKKDGQNETPITSDQITVTKLRFKLLSPPDAPEGAQIHIEARANTGDIALQTQTLSNFTTSTMIRYR